MAWKASEMVLMESEVALKVFQVAYKAPKMVGSHPRWSRGNLK